MKSNKWKFVLTGAATHLTDSLLPDVITINYKKQYCTNNRYFYFKNKTNNSNYFTGRTRTALMMKAKPLL